MWLEHEISFLILVTAENVSELDIFVDHSDTFLPSADGSLLSCHGDQLLSQHMKV